MAWGQGGSRVARSLTRSCEWRSWLLGTGSTVALMSRTTADGLTLILNPHPHTPSWFYILMPSDLAFSVGWGLGREWIMGEDITYPPLTRDKQTSPLSGEAAPLACAYPSVHSLYTLQASQCVFLTWIHWGGLHARVNKYMKIGCCAGPGFQLEN